jgi:hypothetical protein
VDTITDSHGYRAKRDNGFDVTTYRLSGKLTDPTGCSLLCHCMVDLRGNGSGVNGYDVSVKVEQLSGALYAAQTRGATMIGLAIGFVSP